MANPEHALIFARATGNRLLAAEQIVLALPHLSAGALVEVDLAWRAASSFLAAVARFSPDGYGAAVRERLAFWTGRFGGRAAALAAMGAADALAFRAHLEQCDVKAKRISSGNLLDASARVFAEAGAPPARRRAPGGPPVLHLDVGGPGWEGVSFRPDEDVLFLPGPLAPPLGDEIALSFRLPGVDRPVPGHGIVLEVLPPRQATAGHPAGYGLGLWQPPAELREALAQHAPASAESSRAAPRFQMKAPVRIAVPAPAAPAAPRRAPPPPPAPRALIEYATEQELAADFIQNLSQGGAYVRTSTPPGVGSPVELELRLPNGAELRANAVVAFTNANGMGVRFQLAPDAEAILSNAMAHISARARRALVVDDDELVCRMIADALRDRGFEVVTAAGASEGLSTLAEELLALDLLVTDLVMPGMNGEEFVRLIRKTGGEVDLAIVGVTGQLAEGVELRLEAAGADAVLDKSLGPDLIAQAADAVLERKRLVAGQR